MIRLDNNKKGLNWLKRKKKQLSLQLYSYVLLLLQSRVKTSSTALSAPRDGHHCETMMQVEEKKSGKKMLETKETKEAKNVNIHQHTAERLGAKALRGMLRLPKNMKSTLSQLSYTAHTTDALGGFVLLFQVLL